jgi:alkylated DNA repair dioxygenase AlkB
VRTRNAGDLVAIREDVTTEQLSLDPQLDAGPRASGRWPDGLVYQPGFLTPEEEARLVSLIESLELRPMRMRGQDSKRTVRHFGLAYEPESAGLSEAEPIPPPLTWLRDRCAAFAEVEPDRLVEALLSRYPEGAGIGWHRDAPKFGPKVVGVSLASSCRMRFQRGRGERREVFALELEPRSAYVIGGTARSAWEHSIPATKALRYSITFRSEARCSS